MAQPPVNSATWYDQHSDRYIADTGHLDLSPLYARFLAHLPGRARILDAGCGSGRDALATRRAAGTDPAHGGGAGKSRGRSNATHQAAVATWERAEGEKSEPEHFTRDILPMLQNVSLSKMAKATGLTEGYCSFVRRGLKIPHRRHWEAFAKLGNNREEWGMHVSD